MDVSIFRQLKTNHFRLISALAEHGQLSLAAEVLAITQPAASRMLAEIEQLLGTQLCQRHPRGMELTLTGRAMARRAHNILMEMRGLARDIGELEQGMSGIARVGAVTGASVGYLVPAIRQLKAISPQADIMVSVAPSRTLVPDLLAGHHDFILGRVPPEIHADELEVQAGLIEQIELVVHASHPLSSVSSISLNSLGNYSWVMQASDSPIRQALQDAFWQANARFPDNIITTASLLVMLAMLASSRLIVPMAREVYELLSGQAIGTQLRRLPVQETIAVTPYHLIQVRERELPPLARRLRGLVLEEMRSG
ncbi:MAG: LysR family transcriptional regulator [Thiolinea sp.]